MKYLYVLLALSIFCLAGWGPMKVSPADKNNINTIESQAGNLDPKVLELSLMAYQRALAEGKSVHHILTIIDYSKPSTERRLWIIDLDTKKVLFNTYVAHGKNSGGLRANSFSNKSKSLKSSFGVFLTDQTFTGHNGYSLRIKGLEKGVNDNVYNRSVIFHGAKYVSEAYAKAKGMMGRSWGCMAVSFKTVRALIDTIKDRTVVVAYYPDKKWLRDSPYVRSM